MDTFCPLCDPKARGISVHLASSAETDRLISSLSRHAKTGNKKQSGWTSIDSRTVWLDWRYFCRMVPYLSEFFTPQDWTFFHTSKSADGFQTGEPCTFASLVADIPKLWVNDIIEHRRIRMMYQPIVHMSNEQVLGHEMLARGLDVDGSVIPPNELFHSAREQDELFRLDRTCRIAAIEAGAKLESESLIFINFIPTSIYIPEHCLASTMTTVRKLGIDHARVVFEVVETDKVKDLAHLKSILDFYRSQGFRYALDDVGSGHNNLDTLAALRPDVVKLDRQYARDIHSHDEKRRRAIEVAELARDIGAIPLAEGIESSEEAVVLCDIGYEWQQGYLYGKPDWTPQKRFIRHT